jgi:hypothetical protein
MRAAAVAVLMLSCAVCRADEKPPAQTPMPTPAPSSAPAPVPVLETFKGEGVTFKHPPSAKVYGGKREGYSSLTVSADAGYLVMVQVFPATIDEARLRGTYAVDLKKSFTERKFKVEPAEGSPAKRTISGAEREGVRFEVSAAAERHSAEVYVFRKGDRVFGVILQSDAKSSDPAAKLFSAVCESLE